MKYYLKRKVLDTLHLALMALIILSFTYTPSIVAKVANCEPDLTHVNSLLAQAEETFDSGNGLDGIQLVSEARAALELIEANCLDYASETAGNSRTNPVSFGERQRVEISDRFVGSIQIVNYVDNANDIVQAANERNDPPEDGMRFIVIEFSYSCELSPSESCEFETFDFDVVGRNGLVYDSINNSDRGFSDDTEIFGGTEIILSRVYEVAADDTDFVFFNHFGDVRVYFATV